MPDQFTVITHKGWGSRIKNAISGVFVGVLLFVGSFVILYFNEGSFDYSKLAATSKSISVDIVEQTNDRQFVSVTGPLLTEEPLEDLYLQAIDGIKLSRKVEMYAWKEERDIKTTKNVGGSETEETTYRYIKDWLEYPKNTQEFKLPESHENPQKALNSVMLQVKKATIGKFELSPDILEFPDPEMPVFLSGANTKIPDGAALIGSEYFYIPQATGNSYESPVIGDLRVSYYLLPSEMEVTAIGQQSGNRIVPYYDQENHTLGRVLLGQKNQAMEQLRTEFLKWLWGIRVVGFIVMWVGMYLWFAPLSVFLDVLPVFGTVSRTVTGSITFISAFILSIATILTSKLTQSPLALMTVALLIIFVLGFVVFRKAKKLKPVLKTM